MPHLNAITALVYTDSAAADALLREVAVRLRESGLALAGLVQLNRPRLGRSRCDMILEDLGSGRHVPISEDRGPHARGCALDVGRLLTASECVRASMDRSPDLVILNKFGKIESEGGGFRPLIGEVMEREIPLLIAVPWRNIESWRLFAGGLAAEVPIETGDACLAAICRPFLNAALDARRTQVATIVGPPRDGDLDTSNGAPQ
jgi:nucleoside-triphosphatase THEP1